MPLAMLLEEELYDKNYVARFTEGLEAHRQTIKDYAPENVEHLTGIPARDIRQAMRTFAAAPSATVRYGRYAVWPGRGCGKRPLSLALLTGNLDVQR
jgi:formate dehydrogenase major subunit